MNNEWKMVPVVPTEEMLVALGGMGWMVQQKPESYAAMLAAAPTPPASAQDDAKDERKTFEAWAGNKGWPLSPYQNNCGIVVAERYGHRTVQKAWEAWQERASVEAPAAGDALAIDLDRVLSIADEHAEESREDGRRVLDRGGLLALARDVLRVAEAPNAAGNALDAERWRFIRRKLCLTGNGDGTCAMQAINLPASIHGWPEPGPAIAEFCDSAIDAAISQQSHRSKGGEA